MLKVVAILAFLKFCWTATIPPPGVVTPPQLPLTVKPSSVITPSVIPIISEENVVEHDGSFHYGYETGDGTVVHQEGQLKVFEDGKEGEVVQGSYTYIDKDGHTYTVTYVADETGFHPQGEHLPEVPAPIVRALKYIEEHPPPPEVSQV